MPMIYFFPWAKISGPLVFGSFHLAPFSRALASGEIPAGLKDAIGAVLEAYGFWRDVDRRSVPVLRHESATFTADLSDDEVAERVEAKRQGELHGCSTRRCGCHSDVVLPKGVGAKMPAYTGTARRARSNAARSIAASVRS